MNYDFELLGFHDMKQFFRIKRPEYLFVFQRKERFGLFPRAMLTPTLIIKSNDICFLFPFNRNSMGSMHSRLPDFYIIWCTSYCVSTQSGTEDSRALLRACPDSRRADWNVPRLNATTNVFLKHQILSAFSA